MRQYLKGNQFTYNFEYMLMCPLHERMWQERGPSLGLNETMVTYSFEVLITGISKLCHCQFLITPIMFLHVVYAPCCSVITCTVILFPVYEKTLNRRPMLLRIVSTGILLPISRQSEFTMFQSYYDQADSFKSVLGFYLLFSAMLLCKTRLPQAKLLKGLWQ